MTKLAANYSKQVHATSDAPHLRDSSQLWRLQMPFKHYELLPLNHLTQQFNLQLVQLVLFSASQAENKEAHKQYLSLNCWEGRRMDNCGSLHSFITHECPGLSSLHPPITVFTDRDEPKQTRAFFHLRGSELPRALFLEDLVNMLKHVNCIIPS